MFQVTLVLGISCIMFRWKRQLLFAFQPVQFINAGLNLPLPARGSSDIVHESVVSPVPVQT